ncbi:hypothetical protein ACHHYP_03146 [Achlya hypogyna]|uniref:Uncharacterized protein n=1 Tax=Achlya hypogyna TaxID=1202772 RepID=A0A1V9Z4G8_ACHHY|nr:hypothetical protein ACHHYP_03146 [Achlya hypogyna]
MLPRIELDLAEPTAAAARAFTSASKEVSLLLRGKNYLRDQKAFMAHLRLDALKQTAWAAGLVVVYDAIFSRDPEKDDDADSMMGYVLRPWCASFGRALGYVTVTRLLEAVCVEALPPHLAGKLMKNLFTSALRKYARFHDKVVVARLMLRTTARASLLPTLAVFLVEQLVLLWHHRRPTTYARATARNAHRWLLALAGASVGAAIGSLLEPGRGTVVGAVLGQDLACFHTTLYFHNERFQDLR